MEENCKCCVKAKGCKLVNPCKERGYRSCRYYEGLPSVVKRLTSFEEAARPLIKWLCENEHPHVTAIVTPTSCELLEGKKVSRKILDYVVD